MREEFGHLRPLSRVKSEKNIKFLTPAVYSGGWCPMRVACNICEEIEGLSYLMVGMPECSIHSRGMTSLPEGEHGELRWLYVLDADEVIFGCREGVMDALRTMDAAGARAILMIATCVTDLIGEDFEGIIREIQPQLRARLSYVTLGQFKNFGSGAGAMKTAEALGTMMEPRERKPRQVNALLSQPWHSRNTPVEYPLIVGALEKMGVSVRRLAAGATLNDYLAAPDAALNLVLTAYDQPLAARMEEKFGIPYAPLHSAFSVAQTDAVYAQIESALGVELKTEFAPWRRKAAELEDRARRELPGLRFTLLTEVDMPVALALYLTELGMEPLLIHIGDLHREDELYGKKIKALGYDPLVCRIMYQDKDVALIRDALGPDVSFGYLKEPLEGFPCVEEMGDHFGITGYERTVGILLKLFSVLETGKMEGKLNIYGPAPV